MSYTMFRDAGAMVRQGGQRATQGHFRRKASEVNRKFGGPGVLLEKILGPQRLDWLKLLSRIFQLK